jgi:hypothetical protein
VSRRHHGGRPHRANGHARPGEAPRAPGRPSFDGALEPSSAPPTEPRDLPSGYEPQRAADTEPSRPAGIAVAGSAVEPGERGGGAEGDRHIATNGHGDPPARANGHVNGAGGGGDAPGSTGCTAPQLRRFIKSRPYVPMHELRRRFGINGGEDDVTSVALSTGRVFVGLPPREGALLGELLRGGEIGYELSLDPQTPVVVGLYPMRPVARS